MKLLLTFTFSAIVALNPAWLDPLRLMNAGWMPCVREDEIDPVEGAMTLLVAEGIWYMDLFQFQGVSDDLRKQILQRLVEATRA